MTHSRFIDYLPSPSAWPGMARSTRCHAAFDALRARCHVIREVAFFCPLPIARKICLHVVKTTPRILGVAGDTVLISRTVINVAAVANVFRTVHVVGAPKVVRRFWIENSAAPWPAPLPATAPMPAPTTAPSEPKTEPSVARRWHHRTPRRRCPPDNFPGHRHGWGRRFRPLVCRLGHQLQPR